MKAEIAIPPASQPSNRGTSYRSSARGLSIGQSRHGGASRDHDTVTGIAANAGTAAIQQLLMHSRSAIARFVADAEEALLVLTKARGT